MLWLSIGCTLFLFLLYSLLVFLTKAKALTHSDAMLCHNHERSALLHFKQTISLNHSDSSAYPKTDSWKGISDCCSWDGVECDDKTGYVIGLHLSSSLLYGILHSNSTIFSLDHLQTLNLAGNDFRNSPIPPQISHLSSLSTLNLSLSAFSGQIPLELSGLSKLTSLDLSKNNLYGDFPIDIFHLPDLLVLNVSDNGNLTGFLPEFNQTSSIRELELYFTNFSGNLPVSIRNLQSLVRLSLGGCYFSGSIPATSMGNLTQLTLLSLHSNMFDISGRLSWLNKLTRLTELDLYNTNLYGHIPPSLANLTQLTYLDLGHNHFVGEIPLWLMNMTGLTTLFLFENELTGPIPSSFSQLKNLEILSLYSNMFNKSGRLSWLDKLTKLTLLELRDTNLYGDIPPSLANLTQLTHLDLGANHFAGEIPLWLMNMTQLTYLSLYSNMFKKSGRLSWLNKLTKLTLLDLWDTNPYGDIPPSLANLTQLTYLDLGHNHFAGEIPLWLMNMTGLTTLALFENELSGPIPSSFSQLKNLESLDLAANNLNGTVEADIFLSLRKLTFLSLSNNKITLLTHHHFNFTLPQFTVLQLKDCNLREIPYFLQFQKNLEVLSLSENNIQGKIPQWIWNTSDSLGSINLSGNFLSAMEQNLIALPSKSLRLIDISDNMLQGNLPIPPPDTIVYHVSNNRLTGDITPLICRVRSLEVLELSNNSMSGQIPHCLGNSLIALDLGGNNFSGTIPQICSEECNLKVMDLSQNQIGGQVPKSLSNCKMLQILDLSDNEIEDTFPSCLGAIAQLQVLILHSNKFHGAIRRPQLTSDQFSMLRIVDLSGNSFTGDLPVKYIQTWNAMRIFRSDMEPYIYTQVELHIEDQNWTVEYQSSITVRNKGIKRDYEKIPKIFTAIDLSSNKFTGKIPESFGSLEALQLLDLSNNELTGPIPPSVGKLGQLESLDLSRNKLSGVIPQQLASQLNFLAYFNVSYNLLSGPIPQGPQFKTFENNSYEANSGLCGFPLTKNCGTVPSPPGGYDDSDYNGFHSGYEWIFILAGLGSGIVVGFVMGNILTDRHPWLIGRILRNFGGRTQKNFGGRTQKRRKRQIIDT